MWGEMELAYVGLQSRQPAAVASFLGQGIGLMPAAAPAGASFRNDGKWRRLWVEPGAHDDAACVGFELASEAALDAAQQRLAALGYAPQAGSAADCAERGVGRLLQVTSPWGTRVELVLGLRDAATPFASADFPDGFVTGRQGFGHLVFAAADAAEYQAACRFATEGLGMRTTDWLRLPTPGGDLLVTFLHCNARHHTMAIALAPGPAPERRLHHINLEVASVQQVGQAHERALQRRLKLANTIGQHENDEMVSFYAFSPDGWAIEIGATGRTVGPDWTDRREYQRISLWGHQPPEVLSTMLA